MPDTIIVPVVFSYKQKAYPHEGNGKLNGYEKSWLSRMEVAIPEAHPDDAAVVAELSMASGDTLPLRRHAGTFYRPVLAPGTHEPCDLESFARAASGEEPWRDTPFTADTSRNYYSRSAVDSNRPTKPLVADKDWPNPEAYRKLGEDNRVERLRETASTAADLLVVDGVVHRRCEQPVLVLKTIIPGRGKAATALRLEWAMPGLEGDHDPVDGPVTIMYPEKANPAHHRGVQPQEEKPRGDRSPWERRPWRTFGLTEVAEATLFGEALSERMEIPFQAREPLVTVLREWTLDAPPVPSMEEFHKKVFGAVQSKVTGLSRDTVLDWLEIRDRKEELSDVESLDILSRVLAREADRDKLSWSSGTDMAQTSSYGHYGSSNTQWATSDPGDAMACLLRFDLIERHRAHAMAMAPLDEEALAGIDPDEGMAPAP